MGFLDSERIRMIIFLTIVVGLGLSTLFSGLLF